MSNCAPPLNRFNQPSKLLLVEMINKFNAVRLDATQLVFSNPEVLQNDGLTQVTVKFRDKMGWSPESRPVTYYRIEANRHEQLSRLVVHAEYLADSTALLKAVFDQCGVLLEPDLVEITEIFGGLESDQTDISNLITQPFLNGFDGADDVPYMPDPDADRNFMIKFKANHLIFFGHLFVMARPALTLLGNTVARRMDFRDYYQDGIKGRPPVDLYIPQGRILVGDVWLDQKQAKTVEAYLYEQKAGAITAVDSAMDKILKGLTGDVWVYTPDAVSDFNIYNSTVLYNGLVTPEYSADDSRYSYVMVIQLGDNCRNLSGLLRIGYRYSAPTVPGNRQINPASATPLFQH